MLQSHNPLSINAGSFEKSIVVHRRMEIIKKGNETLAIYKEFYPFFKEHPEDENLKKFKSNAQKLIPLCKEFGVDYKAVLSAEILKFYGFE